MVADAVASGTPARFLTIAEVIREAKLRLSPSLWDMVSGAAGGEITMRRNRLALETYAFRSRLLRGIVRPDLRTTVLGHPIDSPVMLAPIGSIQQYCPDGALSPARVAGQKGTISFVGTLSAPDLTEVAAGSSGPLVLQIYVRGDRDWLSGLVRKAEAAGYIGLCLTADSAGQARRERDLHSRHLRESPPQPNIPQGLMGTEQFQARFNWDDFSWLRSITRLPIILKGVLAAEDAVEAVDRGADAIYVSNHGGRELDHNPSTIEVLAEIVAAVGDRTEVYVDSGFLHGGDVVKGLALGARAVLIGRLQVWAIAAAGEDGLTQALDILEDELLHDLRHLGAASVAELCPSHVRPTMPVASMPYDWNEYEYLTLPRI